MSGLVGYGSTPVKITTGFNTPNLKEFKFENGNIQLPLGGNVLDHLGNIIVSEGYTTGNIAFSEDSITNINDSNPVVIRTTGLDSTNYDWVFVADGTLMLPSNGGALSHVNNRTRVTNSDITNASPTVVWTSESSIVSSVKLKIQLEQDQVGDPTGFHTHSCEAIISARGANQLDAPVMSVFGVVSTFATPLVTFTVQRNMLTGLIELVGTLADGSNSAYLDIYSIETGTRGL